MRRIVWFSCGAASAVLAKKVVEQYGHSDVHVVYCDLLSDEHPDNRRFLVDVEKLIDHPIEIIRSEKFSSITEVFGKRKYMSGVLGAPCTQEMKRIPRNDYQKFGDIQYFGLTFDEFNRIVRFENNNPNLSLEWPLRDLKIKKHHCYRLLDEWGIKIPEMYQLGFKNNNCVGCVKATGVTYWSLVYRYFPEVFRKRAIQSRELNVRLIQVKGERKFLDELIPDYYGEDQEDIDCGPICVREYENVETH